MPPGVGVLVWVLSTMCWWRPLADPGAGHVLVDEIYSNGACGQDAKAHGKGDTHVHADVNTLMGVYALLCCGHDEGLKKEEESQGSLHVVVWWYTGYPLML